MRRSRTQFCLFAVLPLLISAIWLAPATAAVAPAITSLGQIREEKAPSRLDVDANGNLYLLKARAGQVARYDRYGRLTARYEIPALSGGGLAVTPDGRRIFASAGTAVAVIDGLAGKSIGFLGKGEGEFGAAGWIDLDADGFVYVADLQSRFVKVFDPQYRLFKSFGRTAQAPFPSIFGMAVHPEKKEVYVANAMTGTGVGPGVQVFSLDGTLLRTLPATGGFGTVPMTFFGGITFDPAGRAYFLDTYRSEIRTLSLPNAFLSTYAKVGFAAGQLNHPMDVAYEPNTSRLFVLCDGDRVEVLGIDGGTNPVKVNAKPGLAVPVSPIAGTETETATPDLLFRNAQDGDNDPLVYTVRVLKGEQTAAEYHELPAGQDQTLIKVGQPLEENAAYRWTVQASDGLDLSGWSEMQSFYVNAVQEAPAAPALLALASGEEADGHSVFAWEAASDPDPFDTVSYRLQISGDPSFATPVVDQALAATSVRLADCTDYSALQDGKTYFWQVQAIDNHGLVSAAGKAGSFIYDATVLQVTANMPGTRVHLGGNPGYAGRPVGEAPVELCDLAPGVYSVVVERAGFEMFLGQVNLAARENVKFHASLMPATASIFQNTTPVSLVNGYPMTVNGQAVPFAIDYDHDGIVDLLVGNAAASLSFFKGTLVDDELRFIAGVDLGLMVPGASPFVADWNNDGRKDLLVGGQDGTVTLFLNVGSEEAPCYDAGTHLQAAGVPVAVAGAAAPVVVDFDGDGAKDLVVGSTDSVAFYRNAGTDAEPKLNAAVPLLQKLTAAKMAFPWFADWNADGRKDLLVSLASEVWLYTRQADGTFAEPQSVYSAFEESGKKNKEAVSVVAVAADLDGKKGKDLLLGTSAGELLLAASHGKDYLPSFSAALLDKVVQLEEIALRTAANLSGKVAAVRTSLEAGDLKEAQKATKELIKEAAAGSELATVSDELLQLL